MKYKNCLIVVKDIDKSVEFYRRVLGLRVTCDFGANKTLTGGVCLQTLDTWITFIHKEKEDVTFQGNAAEWYFEEDDMDSFIGKLNSFSDIKYVHAVEEAPWGQRTVKFYDPDLHIIEVGENLKSVVERFMASGMNTSQVAQRMDIDIKYVERLV